MTIDRDLDLYRERGYHIAEGLLTGAFCDEIVNFAVSHENATDKTFKPIAMAHRVAPFFLDILRYRPVVDLVERIVGGRASGIGSEFFYMRPGTRGFAAHQDNFYIQAPPDAFVSAWIALCDTDRENGGPTFFAESHCLGTLPVRSGEMLSDPGQNPGARAVETILPEGYSPFEPRLAKGSVIFFHGNLVHYSNDNRSDRFRYSFLGTYIRSGQPFRAGTYQKRTEVNLRPIPLSEVR